jgi:ferredoxin-like protein FixX
MLGIKDRNGRWREWHVNESMPKIDGQVVEFQADGHELDLILLAMAMPYNYDGTIGLKVPKCPKCGSKKLSCHQNGCTWKI